MFRFFRTIGIIVVGIVALALFVGENEPPTVVVTKADGSTEQGTGQQILVGDVITTDSFEILVLSWEIRKKVGTEFFQSEPNSGATYVAVKWRYKNISSKPTSAFSTPDLNLIDPNGNKYDPDIGASSNFATEAKVDEKILSDLNPGITAEAADVFEVSVELFDSSSWSFLSMRMPM